MSGLSFGGLATGMDTESIINQLVQLEQLPIYNYKEEISELEQLQGAWRDVNGRLDRLEDRVSDLKFDKTYNSRSSSSSDNSVATATATSEAIEADYNITVNNVATSQRISGSRMDDSAAAIKDLTGFDSIPTESRIQINGSEIAINDTDTLSDITNKINDADAGVNASIVDNHLILESTETGEINKIALVDDNDLFERLGILQSGSDDGVLSTNPLEVSDADSELGFTGSFRLKVLNESGTTESLGEITVDETMTLNDIKAEIDGISNLSASVIEDGNGNFSLEVTSSVANSSIKLANTGSDNNILEKLNFGNRSISNELESAQNAEIEINGITGITNSSNEFTDAVNGVTFNIDPDAADGSAATVSVSKDTAKTTEAVQAFVDQYNSVMSFIDDKTYYDADKEKGGILQGDGTAMRLQMRLREFATSRVKETGDYQSLHSMGIEVDRHGVMTLDNSKFTEALENSPEEVMNLFNAESDDDGYDGMAVRMDSYLDQLMQTNTGLIPRRLDLYDDQIEDLNDDIEDVERRVEMTRERYVQQFTAMEEAISQMQSQQSWMMSQLQGMGGSSLTNMM